MRTKLNFKRTIADKLFGIVRTKWFNTPATNEQTGLTKLKEENEKLKDEVKQLRKAINRLAFGARSRVSKLEGYIEGMIENLDNETSRNRYVGTVNIAITEFYNFIRNYIAR